MGLTKLYLHNLGKEPRDKDKEKKKRKNTVVASMELVNKRMIYREIQSGSIKDFTFNSSYSDNSSET